MPSGHDRTGFQRPVNCRAGSLSHEAQQRGMYVHPTYAVSFPETLGGFGRVDVGAETQG